MDMKKIGSFIAEKRKEKKMTQVQLGEKLGVTGKTISRWENGNYMPDLSMLIPLSEVLEISVNDLLRGECTKQEESNKEIEKSIVDSVEQYEKLVRRNKKELLQNMAMVGIIVIATAVFLYIAVNMNAGLLHGGLERWKSYLHRQGGAMMNDIFKYVFWTAILAGIFAVIEIVFAFYYKFYEQKLGNLEGVTSGVVTGVLRSHLFKNDIYGEIPGGTIIGWGVAQGERHWGGTLKMRIPPWFPCVRFSVDGEEYNKLTGEGVWKDTWVIGQNVTVIYKPETPGICMIEGDTSYKLKSKICLITALFFTVVCIAASIFIIALI